MAHILQLQGDATVAELQASIKKSRDDGQKTRLRVILGITMGKMRKELAAIFNVHNDTITDIVRRYNEKGIDGLKTNKGGRPEGNPKWDTSIFDDLVKEIDGQKRYWSIPAMIEWIKKNKKKEIPYNTVWYHVRNLHYSYKSARPHPYLGNKGRQESFKKGGSLA